MNGILLVIRLVLCVVFATAGASKLFDRAGSRRALVSFGVPERFAQPLSIALPIAELAVAVALIPVTTAWVGAVAALVLLLSFLVAMTVSSAKGRAPECHCFGQLHSAPVGRSTFLLNSSLSAAAVLLIGQGYTDPGPSVFAWMGELTVGERASMAIDLVAIVLLVTLLVVLWQVLRQQGRLLLRLETVETALTGEAAPASLDPNAPGLPMGSAAPAFDLEMLGGGRASLTGLLEGGKQALLIFANPNCGPCDALMPEVAAWQSDESAMRVLIVSEGSAEENRAKAAPHGVHRLALQSAREVAESYEAWGTPAAVLIMSDGTIGSTLASGAEAIRELVGLARGTPVEAPAAAAKAAPHPRRPGHAGATRLVSIGQQAPAHELPDLEGKHTPVAALNGRSTLLVFWNPGCGFCKRMLADLKAWDTDRPADAPEFLLISSGTAAENRALNLRARILLDEGFKVGSAFGAQGTPSAVLLDGEGRVASDVAVGATAIFALVSRTPETAALAIQREPLPG